MGENREQLMTEIEDLLAARCADVELVDIELRGGQAGTLTLFIDRLDGVDLDLCAAVSQSLEELRDRYALEVSSPGLDRRLRKPAHFAAQLNREVALRLSAPLDGRRNFRGVLTAVAEDSGSLTLTLEDGADVTLPLAEIDKAHLVYTPAIDDGGQRE